MGNYRFRFSDMLPNSWLYKLTRSRHHHNKTANPTHKKLQITPSSSSETRNNHSSRVITEQSDQRKSYHITRDLTNSPAKTRPEPPRKSCRRRRSTRRHRPRKNSAACTCRAGLESVWTKPPDSTPEKYPNSPDRTTSSEHDSVVPECGSDDDRVSCSTPCKCKTAPNDIVIEMDDGKPLDTVPDSDTLPPIITKNQHEPTKFQRTSAEFSERNAYGSLRVKVVKEDLTWSNKGEHHRSTTPCRRFPTNSSSSPGLKLRTNSPRILNRRRRSTSSNSSSGLSRRSVSESFAVVKSSRDPRRDFRESMEEMIVEYNIRGSKDLEELLACYLSLNSDEYHDLIINVFKQIWFDFIVHLRIN